MDNTCVTVTTAEDLLAYIPYALGFHPRQSVVIMALLRPGGPTQVGPIARLDLNDLDMLARHDTSAGLDPAGGPLGTIRTLFTAEGAGKFITVVYCDSTCVHTVALDDLTPAIQLVRRTLSGGGIDVALWLVTRDDFAPLVIDGPVVRAGQPQLAHVLESTVSAATMVSLGASIAGGREDIARLPQLDGAETSDSRRWQRRWWGRRGSANWASLGFHMWAETIERPAATLQGRQAGHMAAALRDLTVRDAVLAHIVDPVSTGEGGRGTLPDLHVVADTIAAATAPGCGRRPSAARVDHLIDVVSHVAAMTADEHRAPLLTLLGWVCWWGGHNVAAGVWLERATQADPSYRLALLLRAGLGSGLRPGWALEP